MKKKKKKKLNIASSESNKVLKNTYSKNTFLVQKVSICSFVATFYDLLPFIFVTSESVTLTAFEEVMVEGVMLPARLSVVIQNRYNKHLRRQYYLGIQSLLTDIGR